jgi:hypothetical protein
LKAIERLFSCASAHGIDLKQAAGESANLYGAGAPRRRQLMRRLAGLDDAQKVAQEVADNREHLPESVKGKQTRVSRPRLYSHAELGQALSGLPESPYHAAMYSFGLDEGSYDAVYRELRLAMTEMDSRQKWPLKVQATGRRMIHYGDELCEVVLLADWCKPFFMRVPALYAIYLDIPEETWMGTLMRPYLDTLTRYDSWLRIARAFVERRIREELEYATAVDRRLSRSIRHDNLLRRAPASIRTRRAPSEKSRQLVPGPVATDP